MFQWVELSAKDAISNEGKVDIPQLLFGVLGL